MQKPISYQTDDAIVENEKRFTYHPPKDGQADRYQILRNEFMGTRLGEVPDHYWRWFLQQEWSSKYPDLVAYAQYVEDE